MSKPAARRCAIYTRKSSDEGLDQAFNSLDAQREAGEAYVKSQASEGWRAMASRYDDGGYSGGSLERPALQRLLGDVEAGLIEVVVVYKIDRLTRSLADFARIVERFDARAVSFVSVTQAFNTTSSMGRLTLNVLLSFAQFEREVTGERIRDKIAASKAKGMWMGGLVPLGYDAPADSARVLRVNPAEAATVQAIFARYLELGSVHRLAHDLATRGIVSKRHVAASGRTTGSLPFSRGALFHLLRNPIYTGRIAHKGTIHAGAHAAIIDSAIFDAVQAQLDRNARRRGPAGDRRVVKAPLTGRLFDAAGEPMSPAFSRGRGGCLYRYYVSTSLQTGRSAHNTTLVRRVPADAIEQLVSQTLARLLPHQANPMAKVIGVYIRERGVELILPARLALAARQHLAAGEEIVIGNSGECGVILPIALPLRGRRRAIALGVPGTGSPDRVLIAALRKAHAMLGRDRTGRPLLAVAPISAYERRILRLAFLSPALQRDIIAGHQPRGFNLEAFMKAELPLAWDAQHEALGWPLGSLPSGLALIACYAE